MSASFQENPQEEPEGLEQWRQGGLSARKVKRLQQRVQNILGDWLDYYRRATGISHLSFCSFMDLNVMFLSPLGPPYNLKVGFRRDLWGSANVTIGFLLPLCYLCSDSSEKNEFWRPLCLGAFGFVAFSRPVFLAFCFFNLETLYTV